MPVFHHECSFRRLSADELAAWKDAEAAPVSDCLNRSQAMDGGISPLSPSMKVVGQAGLSAVRSVITAPFTRRSVWRNRGMFLLRMPGAF